MRRLSACTDAAAFAAAILPAIAVWFAKIALCPRPFCIHFGRSRGHLLLRRPRSAARVAGQRGQFRNVGAAALRRNRGDHRRDPHALETFLSAAHSVELLLVLIGAAIVFYGVLRGAGSLARIIEVWLYFAAGQALERMDVWSREIFYWPIGAGVLAPTLPGRSRRSPFC
jgi:hypothetical protein